MVVGSLETVKTVSDVAANVATIFALLVGAVWAVWALHRERTRWPKAELALSVSHRDLTADRALLQVKVVAHNLGALRITVKELHVDVSQVLPLDEKTKAAVDDETLIPKKEEKYEAVWPLLPGGSRIRNWRVGGQPRIPEIEPGESDEFCFDLIVPRTLETVHVYAYLGNVKHRRREFGWVVTAFYDLSGETGEKRISFGSSEPKVALRSRPTSSGSLPKGQQEPRRPRPGGQPGSQEHKEKG